MAGQKVLGIMDMTRMGTRFHCIPILLMKKITQRSLDIKEGQHICIFRKRLMGIRLLELEVRHLEEIELYYL